MIVDNFRSYKFEHASKIGRPLQNVDVSSAPVGNGSIYLSRPVTAHELDMRCATLALLFAAPAWGVLVTEKCNDPAATNYVGAYHPRRTALNHQRAVLQRAFLRRERGGSDGGGGGGRGSMGKGVL